MKKDDMVTTILVSAAVILTASIIAGLFFVNIPEANKDMVNIVVGVVIGGAFMLLYNWRFGSSKGSSDKNEMLSKKEDNKGGE